MQEDVYRFSGNTICHSTRGTWASLDFDIHRSPGTNGPSRHQEMTASPNLLLFPTYCFQRVIFMLEITSQLWCHKITTEILDFVWSFFFLSQQCGLNKVYMGVFSPQKHLTQKSRKEWWTDWKNSKRRRPILCWLDAFKDSFVPFLCLYLCLILGKKFKSYIVPIKVLELMLNTALNTSKQ